MRERFQQWANRGQISKGDGKKAALCSTLLYGCMHFDALTTLMNTSAFRKHVPTRSAVLHVDLGCGPGTAAWAFINLLQNNDHLVTIGYDHNPHMITLAEDMTSHVANEMSVAVTSTFHDGWAEFEKDVVSRASSHPQTVLITANSFFGQNHVDIEPTIRLISAIRDNARDSLFVFETHPPYNEPLVAKAWNRIAGLSKSQKLYEGRLEIESGNYRGYDDASCWAPWGPDPQLAHIFMVPPSALADRNRDDKRSLRWLRAWLP